MGRPKKRQRTDDEEHTSNGRGNGTGSGQQAWDAGYGGIDMNAAFDSALTPGSLQPWLQSGGDWDFSMPDAGNVQHPNENAVPGLTPDSSSNSPPTLNLPPELQNTQLGSHSHRDPSTQLLLDPSLASQAGSNLGMPACSMPSCACLSTMYLTLNNLQSMDNAFTFPFALHPIREAMQTCAEVIACQECPQRFITAIQNTQLIGTLLMSIAERFSKILESISAEAIRAEAANQGKKFLLQDLNTSTSHLHAGGLGCAAAFSIDLSPAEWRSMSKKVVRAEVHGPTDGNHCCPYFMGLTDQMEERQNYFISHPMPEDFPRDHETGKPIGGPNIPKEDHVCLKFVAYARKLVEGYDWL